jgi:hypothetical protein
VLVPFFSLDAELAEVDSELESPPDLQLSVQMEDDGSKGELKFVGKTEGQVFESRLSMTMKEVRSWQGEAWGKAWERSGWLTGSFRDSEGRLTVGDLELSCPSYPAELAFPPPADPRCEDEWGDDSSDDGMDYSSSEDDISSDN